MCVDILAQFPFTISERELDYYHQKVACCLSWLAFIGKYSVKRKIWTFVLRNCKKSVVEHSIERLTILYFVDLSTIFCPRLYMFHICSCLTIFAYITYLNMQYNVFLQPRERNLLGQKSVRRTFFFAFLNN